MAQSSQRTRLVTSAATLAGLILDSGFLWSLDLETEPFEFLRRLRDHPVYQTLQIQLNPL